MVLSRTFKKNGVEFESDRFEFEGDRFDIVSFKVGEQEKMAIVDKATGDIVSDFHDIIYSYGLPSGKSSYYLVVDDGMFCIYNEDHTIVGGPSSIIYPDGLVKGESNYYIKRRNDGKLVILDSHGNEVSYAFDEIVRGGFIKGRGDCYVGVHKQYNGEREYILVHKDGTPLTPYIKSIPDPETYKEGSDYILTYAKVPVSSSSQAATNKHELQSTTTFYYVMARNGLEVAGIFYTKEKALKSLENIRKLEKLQSHVSVEAREDISL